jgi:hypothetical protein
MSNGAASCAKIDIAGTSVVLIDNQQTNQLNKRVFTGPKHESIACLHFSSEMLGKLAHSTRSL